MANVTVIPAKPRQELQGLEATAKLRVCAYCRVSTDNEEQLSSYEAQVSHYTIGNAYRNAPAAMKIHQAYLRGLWEHSVGVAEIALNIASIYPEIDCDLLIVATLLHDIGKIYEYGYERCITFTT